MTPLLDQALVGALVLAAGAFFVVRFLRTRAAGKSCGGDCCPTDKTPNFKPQTPNSKR